MDNFLALGIVTAGLIGIVALLLYLLPSIVACWRGHHNDNSIIVLNLLLGWTFIGWVAALIWSVSAVRAAPIASASAEARMPCPYCAESILRAAKVCRHCGREIQIPVPPSVENQAAAHGITQEPDGRYRFGDYRYDRFDDALAYAQKQAGHEP